MIDFPIHAECIYLLDVSQTFLCLADLHVQSSLDDICLHFVEAFAKFCFTVFAAQFRPSNMVFDIFLIKLVVRMHVYDGLQLIIVVSSVLVFTEDGVKKLGNRP